MAMALLIQSVSGLPVSGGSVEVRDPRWQIDNLGLQPCGAFYRDGWFITVLLLGVLFWLILWLTIPVTPLAWQQLVSWRYFSLALWQPGWEELLFRGILQGYATHYA